MPGPLHGIRIVDLTTVVSGPLATMMLADQGAEVIKIENPKGGDFTRQVSNRSNGFSASFLNNNRNKKSVAVDLKTPEGVELVKRLVATADAVVQNFRPGAVERLGLGYEDLKKVNPAIVYCSISGFGARGPYAERPVYDPLIQALSGLTTVQAGSDGERPRLVRTIVPDKVTGLTAAQAITSALLAKERTGEGQYVELSMLDSVIAFLWHSDMGSQTFVKEDIPQSKAQSFIDLIYETTDGYISVAVQTDKQWRALIRALGTPEWLDDPRFRTAALRQTNIDDRLALTQSVLKTGSSAHWLARLEAEDVPCAPVLTRSEMIGHPQVAANEIVEVTDHPVAGPVRQARPAARFFGTPLDAREGGSALGADTYAIMRDLKYTEEEISAFTTVSTSR
ncbi:MAG: CoA transferase [Alphaproteobacteria bacterium]|nr:CoA transferase [Alphaproteobacteria bacterium]